MNVRKPILVIKLPREISQHMFVEFKENFKCANINNDYHVLIFVGNNDSVSIKLLHGKGITRLKKDDVEKLKIKLLAI